MKSLSKLVIFPILLAPLAAAPRASADDATKRPPPATNPAKATLIVTSSAFKSGEAMPSEYTCDGADKTPPLAWSTVPSGTKSIAVLMQDLDAPKPNYTHWLVTNIPASSTALAAGAMPPVGATLARNDQGSAAYTGPCPPSGRHRYRLSVYALDKDITAADADTFTRDIKNHVLAEGSLTVSYEKAAGRAR